MAVHPPGPVQRSLTWLHRWLGIGVCLLFVAWFVSGLVMMYVGYPSADEPRRLAGLERLDWGAVQVGPDEAMQAAGLAFWPQRLQLEMLHGEPVWRIRDRGAPLTVSALDARTLPPRTMGDALDVARTHVGDAAVAAVAADATVERDQWTVAGGYDVHRPLHRLRVDDGLGTRVYVSSSTGEVVLTTTRRERVWNAFGAVTHWLYFTELRARPALWRQVILWTSGVATAVALTGLVLGLVRLRRRRYRRTLSPFRGWMAWHHVAGLVGGVFVLTWVFSGWLSVSPPVPWLTPVNQGDRAAWTGNVEARFGHDAGTLRALAGLDVASVEFVWLDGRALLLPAGGARPDRRPVDPVSGSAVTLDDTALFDAARALVPEAPLNAATRLEREDAYWYSHHNERTLPVLRVEFGDEARTWFHIDPVTGRILGVSNHGRRIQRWLFNGLHSLDFRWLLMHRPAWDAVVWTLSIAGLVVSVSGVMIGWRRLRRRPLGARRTQPRQHLPGVEHRA